MRRPPDGQEDALRQTKGFLAYVLLGIHGWAAMLQAWTRWPGTCGQQYFGAQAVMGLVVAGLFPLGWEPDPGIGVFYAYWLLTIVAFGAHRAQARANRRRGKPLHSHFVGVPWLLRFRPHLTPTQAQAWEGALQFGVGLVLLPVSATLSRFWLMGLFANAASQWLIDERDWRRLERMEDAVLEQRHQAESFQRFTRR